MSNNIYKRLINSYRFINPEKENWDGFMDKFPILFKQKDLSMKETCMCWGIECPIGWKDCLEKLCNRLEFLNIEYGTKYKFEIQAEQVKEKFGSLRFYYDIKDILGENEHLDFISDENRRTVLKFIDNEVLEAISDTESITEQICQHCGKPIPVGSDDRVVTEGWVSFICSNCNEKNIEKQLNG